MNADAQFDPLGVGDRGIALPHRGLDFAGAAQRVDDAGELDEQPVAGCLDQPAAMRGDRRVDQRLSHPLQPVEGALLVDADQPRIPGDIGGQDGSQPAFGALSPSGVHGRRA